MTPTERAKRSDALYYETVSVTRRVLCDMIANREADLEDARAESEHMRLKALAVAGELQEESERLRADNDRLREEFNKMDVWHSKELAAAMADNAKLRELVRDYEHCSMHADCDRCEYDGTTSTHCPLSPCFPDIDELHELGVEVDA